MIHPNYPTPSEVDAWCAEVVRRGEDQTARYGGEAQRHEDPPYTHALGVRGSNNGRYLSFPSAAGEGTRFYCFWQPALRGPAPILFHLPGYGAEMAAHPELVAAGFHVMHINPLGYSTPKGADADILKGGMVWPVLPETVRSFGERGYIDWLTDAAVAVSWALRQKEVLASRYAFFGTSQGGGTALLLASIFADRGCCAVAADVPFLTNAPMVYGLPGKDFSAYSIAFNPLNDLATGDQPKAWRALGLVDTMSHAHRLRAPVLLTAGGADGVCPPESIAALFGQLKGTRSFTFLENQAHDFTEPFKRLAQAWFLTYV